VRAKMLILLAISCGMLFAAGWMAEQAKMLEQECARLEAEIELLQSENADLREQRAQLGQRMEAWLDEWDVDVWEATSYAPLDARATAGMCYVGDPCVTASGAEVVPGITAAAGPAVPFGAIVRVEGAGWRVVQDRGSRIGPGHIDLAMASRGEALRWGRRSVKVVYQK
jgi:3D (Asp-Asp-Asp) domain-containing protein